MRGRIRTHTDPLLPPPPLILFVRFKKKIWRHRPVGLNVEKRALGMENRKRTARWIKIISHHKTGGVYLLHVHTRLCTYLFRWQSWRRRPSHCSEQVTDVVIFIEIFSRYDIPWVKLFINIIYLFKTKFTEISSTF